MKDMKEIILRTDKNINKSSEEDVFYFMKKGEKLASALYRVTALLSDQDSLKWKLREHSIDILNDISILHGCLNVDAIKAFESLRLKIDQLTSLLDVCSSCGIISNMNSSILRDEYINLKDIIENYEDRDRIEILSDKTLEETYKRHDSIKDNLIIKDIYKRQSHYKRHLDKPTVSHNRIPRREIIIDFIKKEGESSVKSILNSPKIIGTCSEKTVQREVTDLVNSGILQKKGERRWSKYYL